MNNDELIKFFSCIDKLVSKGFRFSVTHNVSEKTLRICNATDADKIKNCFPEFNIFLGSHNERIVERFFDYS